MLSTFNVNIIIISIIVYFSLKEKVYDLLEFCSVLSNFPRLMKGTQKT